MARENGRLGPSLLLSKPKRGHWPEEAGGLRKGAQREGAGEPSPEELSPGLLGRQQWWQGSEATKALAP